MKYKVVFIKVLKKSKHAVETKNLSISWGEVNVLNQINFELNDGEKLAIVGPSGSGKSTILKILAGLILPTEGELRIFGEKQTYLRLDQNNPPDVRLVFQNPALLGSLTCLLYTSPSPRDVEESRMPSSA